MLEINDGGREVRGKACEVGRCVSDSLLKVSTVRYLQDVIMSFEILV